MNNGLNVTEKISMAPCAKDDTRSSSRKSMSKRKLPASVERSTVLQDHPSVSSSIFLNPTPIIFPDFLFFVPHGER
jgi:hypothetical protein